MPRRPRLTRLLTWALLPLLAAALAPAAHAATAALGAAGMGSFSLEQVYVNVPEMDVFLYAEKADGTPIEPETVRAAGVTLALGDTTVDTGNIQRANEPICYLFAVDNSEAMPLSTYRRYIAGLCRLVREKAPRDQIAVYTLAGGARCLLPATTDGEAAQALLRDLPQAPGETDLTAAATRLYADINANYQSLAPRKAVVVCTADESLGSGAALVGSVLGGALDDLNLELCLLVAAQRAEELEALRPLAGSRVRLCLPEDIVPTLVDYRDRLATALEIKTAIDESFAGERLETFTLTARELGSAIRLTTSVYMGHSLTPPAVTTVLATGPAELTVTFNQPVSAATARLAGSYRLHSEDAWGFTVPVHAVEMSADGTAAVLRTDTLYDGSYSVRLRGVAAAMSSANLSDGDPTAFTLKDLRARDRGFYLARLRLPLLVLAAVLAALAVHGAVRTRREHAAEHAAEVAHLLTQGESTPTVPRRCLTLYIQTPGEIAERRWTAMVECSLLIGSDPAQCELCLPDAQVAPQHCLLAVENGDILLYLLTDDGTDEDAAPRVAVNGQRIAGVHRLQNDDRIEIGATVLRAVL